VSHAPYVICIPSRFQSTRLPGKPLCDLAGKPLIQRVYEQANLSNASSVLVATDDKRIADVCAGFAAEVVMTAANHPSGTDRLAEVARAKQWDDEQIVVNLQGDEPFMPAALLDQVADSLSQAQDCAIATLCKPLVDHDDFAKPDCVKVVLDQNHRALYFSRAPIPCDRDGSNDASGYQHLGLYAYRVGYLKKFARSKPTPLEQLERLEQLRALELGESIHVDITTLSTGVGIDTEDDLQQARQLLS